MLITLKKVGLSDKEARVYLACLELGETTVQRLARKSRVKRTTIYDVLSGLKARGLISTVRKNKRLHYYAESPKVLEHGLDEKRDVLIKAMPELLSVANVIDRKPKIRFYDGQEGIKSVFNDTLQYPGEEILSWVAEEGFYVFDKDFLAHYEEKRIKKKIWTRDIASDYPIMRRIKAGDTKRLSRTRLMKPEQYPLDVSISLYGRYQVGITAFEEETGLIIESPKIALTLKSVFEFSWLALSEKDRI